jgi:uncharacterized protein YlxW (UPF0749 family)
MKKHGSRYILLIVFIIFGIVLAVQTKSTLNTKKLAAAKTYSADVLKEQLIKEQAETDALKKAIDENVADQNKIIDEYVLQQKDDQLARDWEKMRFSAGLVNVKGPGITIKLDDAPARQPDTPLGWQIIHDQDIRIILNDLKKAGAEAISVNGERIAPMSEQVCAGPTILINGNRHPVPFIIEAIGDPDTLYNSIINSSRIAEMTEFNIRVDIAKANEIKLAKFSGADKLDKYISGLEVVGK